MVGPIVNGVALVCGSLGGALLGDKIPENVRNRMPLVFGCASLGMGIVLIVKVRFLPAAVLSLLIGYLVGELMHLESGIQKAAGAVRSAIEKATRPAANGLSHEEYLEKFIAILVLFCASGTGVFGSLNEGMTGDASLLIAKAFLDLFTAAIFATTLGFPVAALAIPQFVIQTALFAGASTIYPMTTPAMIADFSAVGGLIMLATGFRICGMVPFPVAGMLPALVLAMPVSALWLHYFVR
jgi:uncharacterized protein